MNKLFVCAVSALVVSALAVNPHGVCGEDVEWEFNPDTATLTMTGTGTMYDYSRIENHPWRDYMSLIQSAVVGEGVTSLGINAFWWADNMTSVKLPSTLIAIRQDAFYHCIKLASVTLPEGLKRLGLTCFNDCESLTSIKLPKSLQYVGYNTFGDCHKLTKIEVDPDNPNLKSIDGVLFNKTVPNLVQYPSGKAGSYEIPSFVENITGNAFWGCRLLTSLVVPPSVTEIPSGMVHGCTSLKYLYLPDTITSIGSYAFGDCVGLETFVIPAKVASFGHSVFSGCTNLKALSYLGSSEPECGNYMWDKVESLNMICVPASYSSTFCGKAVTCKSSSCGLLNSQCHDWSADGDTCSFEKKKSVKEWEDHSSDCLDYVCENEYGFIAKSKCNDNSMQCMEDKCFNKDDVEGKKWVVYIDFNTSDVTIPESGELVKELVKLSKVDEYDMKVVIEYDEEGGVKRVIVYVDDEDQATDIADAVNKLDKGAGCEGILCKSEKAKTEELIPKTSGASHAYSVMAMFVAMMFILLSIY